jgi:ligand-binding SRPBCC domain-containing protein
VDEQRVGPYKLWHHQHFVEPVESGVLKTDIVSYQPPFGVIGALANKLIIMRNPALEKRYGS